ncbi:hypothetical protein D8L93_09240 [Sodalis-like symbiont of Bactericera trigonica]|nr:hypothetical protein D8L93_09240 [Sodalis-like symbiont of Bactericera trigonica]
MADPQHEIGLQGALNELKAQRVEGVIINLPLAAKSAAAIVADNPELVCLFLDVPPDAGVFHVMFNPGDGTRASVEHLYRLGHRHFALLEGDWSAASGFHCMVAMLKAQASFSAVLVANDQMALGAISALHQ